MRADWTPDADAKLRRMWIAGDGIRAIADSLGVAEDVVAVRVRYMRRHGIDLPKRKKTGTTSRAQQKPRKLPPDRMAMLLALIRSGKSYRQAGMRFGLSRSAVSGLIWRLRKAGMSITAPVVSKVPEIEIEEPPPPPPPPVIRPKAIDVGKGPKVCPVAGCRLPKQPGRDYCAEHLTAAYVARKRSAA